MSKKHKAKHKVKHKVKHRKPVKKEARVKKVVLAAGEALAVVMPRGHTPFVVPEKEHVEIVPVKKKKGWWETLLYGE